MGGAGAGGDPSRDAGSAGEAGDGGAGGRGDRPTCQGELVGYDQTPVHDLWGVTVVEGTVYAIGAESLLPLSCLERITGDLIIQGTPLETLEGLEKLRSVGQAVYITDNSALRTLDGFPGLPLQGSVSIDLNPQLVDLGPLKGVTNLRGRLALSENGLPDYSDLSALASIDGDLWLGEMLPSDLSDLANLRSVGGELRLAGGLRRLRGFRALTVADSVYVLAPSLTTLSDLPSDLTIVGGLVLDGNTIITSLDGIANPSVSGLVVRGFDGLTELAGIEGGNFPGGVWLQDNAGLRSLAGLEDVSLSGGLFLSKNPALVSLAALSNHTVLEGLYIEGNRSLTSVDGLENVDAIAGDLVIVGACQGNECVHNDALVSLRGLSGVRAIDGSLIISGNPALPACEAEWLRDSIGVENIAGNVTLLLNDGAGTCAP
jgi:hypothetical protein